MKIKTLLIAGLLFIFYISQVKGQFSVTLGQRRGTESVTTEVPVFVGNPDSTGISTYQFSMQYPKAGIPAEFLNINYPNLSGAIDTAAILWYLKPENYSPRGEVNIILVTMGSDSVKTFYIDNNNDRTFSDNEDKFVFEQDAEKRILDIKILGNYYNYTLMNPDYVSPFSAPSKISEYSQTWRRISKKPSLNIDFSVLTGGGKTELMIEHATVTYDRFRYLANNHGSFKPSLGLDLSWFNFHIILTGAYERLQFEQKRRIEYATPTATTGKTTFNRNNWPIQKLHAGITAEYDVRISKVYLSPLASYWFTKSIDKNIFDKYFPKGELTGWKSIEAGAKFKIPIANNTILYLKYVYSVTSFEATGFTLFSDDSYIYTPEYKKYNQNYFGFGFQFRITGK